MKITGPPRGPEERKRDVLARLERESDIWVASADADGLPCLVPLWFVWDGQSVWLSTRTTNPTGRNLRDGRRTRLAFGDTRDVVLIDGECATYGGQDVPTAAIDAFLAKTAGIHARTVPPTPSSRCARARAGPSRRARDARGGTSCRTACGPSDLSTGFLMQ